MACLLDAYSLQSGHRLPSCSGFLFLDKIRLNDTALPSLPKMIKPQQFVIVQVNTYISIHKQGSIELMLKNVLQIIKCIQPVSQRLPEHGHIFYVYICIYIFLI